MAPVKTLRWAWGNPQEGSALALVNGPFRNSKTLPLDEVIVQITNQDIDRPVWLWTAKGKREEHPDKSSALHALRLMRRPTVGDWVEIPKRGRDGFITIDEGNEHDTYGVHYGNAEWEFEPYLSVDEVQLVLPCVDAKRWLRLVHMDGELLRFAPADVAANSKVALAAVRQSNAALQHVTSAVVADAIAAMLPESRDRAIGVARAKLLCDSTGVDSVMETRATVSASEASFVEDEECRPRASAVSNSSKEEGEVVHQGEVVQHFVEGDTVARTSKLRGLLGSAFGV